MPSWYGDSVGRYEGDTLVIETVGVKIGPFAMVDMYGTPHSPALHVVERYSLLDHDAAKEAEERGERGNLRLRGSDPGFAPDPNYKGKGLYLEFTVEDEGVFTTPWSAAITYQRPLAPLGQWPESVCADNRHEYYAGKDVPVPGGRDAGFLSGVGAAAGRLTARRVNPRPDLSDSRHDGVFAVPPTAVSRRFPRVASMNVPASMASCGSVAITSM
jgi:hypothetical protein